MASKQSATRTSTRLKTTSTSKMPPAPAPGTRTTRAKAATAPSTTTTAAKKLAPRKPLINRDNAADVKAAAEHKPVRTATRMVTIASPDADREPIMAYLRIRPHLSSDEPASPYLEHLSATTVRMTDPSHSHPSAHAYRPSAAPPSSLYTFSSVFPPATTQSSFFATTALPLVRDLLAGQNALLFAYGVTNSGKTYTVQGGSAEGSAGILPRTLDVVFNSVQGLQSDGRYRPVRLHGIEPSTPSDLAPPINTFPSATPALAQVLADLQDVSDIDADPTILPVDRNYEYSIWLSYAEVYNEKVYDLLDSVRGAPDAPHTATNANGTTHPLLLTRKALPVRPSPPSDSDCGGKYIAGLKHFRVTTAGQAKALLRLGQVHRRVFGTLANSASSRSHGLVTIKVLRGHRGERDDPTTLQISRLTLVDLAGSERTKHTHTTGERLREAGSINKSLMVLGQCMEVMRANQRRVAQALGTTNGARVDTREVKRGLAVVPFRHSRLTEVLMDYFVSDGRAVMIVNVNPYDTGYDENSHVMKFAALAREVYTTPAAAPVQRIPSPTKPVVRGTAPKTLRGSDIAPYRRKVTLETGGAGRKKSEAHVEVVEEDEDAGGEDDGDEPANPLVDALFDEVENLRIKLFEAEMRCAIVEAETREEVMREMEERMRSMETMYTRRLMSEVEQNERKTDAKIDMLHQSGLFGSPVKRRTKQIDESDIEEDDESIETSVIEDDSDHVGSGEEIALETDERHSATESESERSPSPLAGRGKGGTTTTPRRVIRESVPDGPECTPLPREYEENEPDADDITETEEGASEESDEVDDDEREHDNEDEDDWIPPPKSAATQKNKIARDESASPGPPSPGGKGKRGKLHPVPPLILADPSIRPNPRTARRSTRSALAKLEQDMSDLSLAGPDGSVIIVPNKKVRQAAVAHAGPDAEYVPQKGEADAGKKKKRQLGKKVVVTEDQIERVTEQASKSESGRNIRRMARG